MDKHQHLHLALFTSFIRFFSLYFFSSFGALTKISNLLINNHKIFCVYSIAYIYMLYCIHFDRRLYLIDGRQTLTSDDFLRLDRRVLRVVGVIVATKFAVRPDLVRREFSVID